MCLSAFLRTTLSLLAGVLRLNGFLILVDDGMMERCALSGRVVAVGTEGDFVDGYCVVFFCVRKGLCLCAGFDRASRRLIGCSLFVRQKRVVVGGCGAPLLLAVVSFCMAVRLL